MSKLLLQMCYNIFGKFVVDLAPYELWLTPLNVMRLPDGHRVNLLG